MLTRWDFRSAIIRTRLDLELFYCLADRVIITAMNKNIVKIDSSLRDLIPKFMSNMERDTKVMFDAVYSRNLEVLIQTSHRLRGDAPGYGFIEFGEICGRIEDHARQGQIEACEELVERLTKYFITIEVQFIDT